MKDYKKLRKHALICDLISLLVAGVVLFFGSRDELQEWVLILGLVVAIIFLVAAVVMSVKARKLERRAFAAENRRLEELAEQGLTQDDVELLDETQEEAVAEAAENTIEESAEETAEDAPEVKED